MNKEALPLSGIYLEPSCLGPTTLSLACIAMHVSAVLALLKEAQV